eukprot:TRINITY_DN1323_c0_g1_i2.p1 TRINITY_DN1323_c0_g1~~TRINITY_DN1323_c0_g1_i2.p1  ORF type:complete len:424 (+),score=48.47 TRINITY_DN1323_c0_g1_i2:86-1357(+)
MGVCESKDCCAGGESSDGQLVVPEPSVSVLSQVKEHPEPAEHNFAKAEAPIDNGATARVAVQQVTASKFAFEVHGATLTISNHVGKMNPYAVVSLDGSKVLQTEPHVGGHKNPVWNEGRFVAQSMPDEMRVEIWRTNMVRSPVLCGSTTIPISDDMGSLKILKFELTRRRKRDMFSHHRDAVSCGHVILSLEAISSQLEVTVPQRASKMGLGQEFDTMVRILSAKDGSDGGSPTANNARSISLKDNNELDKLSDDGDDEEHENAAPMLPSPSVRSSPARGFEATSLIGSWKCVDTQNLGEFLAKQGVGTFQRKIALGMKWPKWEFVVEGSSIIFNNHSAIGLIREVITLDEEYEWVDGQKNKFSCITTWAGSSQGGVLRTKRTGTLGSYSEERRLVDDKLDLHIDNPGVGSWFSRSFVREAES